MTLTARLTGFSLTALAAVLIGFSAVVLVLAWADLRRHIDERVRGTLDTMAAAVEVKPNGVEWEPGVRGSGAAPGPDYLPVTWAVYAEEGGLLDHAPGPRTGDLLAGSWASEAEQPLADWTDPRGRAWRVALRRIDTPGSGPIARRKYRGILVAAGVCVDDVTIPLYQLGGTLALASAVIWGAAALLARRLCRAALTPVRRMAAAARGLRATDLSARLPVPPTGDELTELAAAFNDLLDRVQEAFERQRAFTAEASHQFRTPLAGIMAQTAVALRSPREPADYRRVLQLTHDRADDLRRMVEALLFLARADADAPAPDREEFDLAGWLRAHLTSWADRPRQPDLRVSTPDGPVPVLAHPVLLGQLLDNLLDNALKYGLPATPVAVAVRVESGWVAVAVADHGPGIPSADVPRLFDPFYRTEGARLSGVPGFGLGLAIARRLAEAVGGRLTAESEPGRGSRFTVWLPAPPAGRE